MSLLPAAALLLLPVGTSAAGTIHAQILDEVPCEAGVDDFNLRFVLDTEHDDITAVTFSLQYRGDRFAIGDGEAPEGIPAAVTVETQNDTGASAVATFTIEADEGETLPPLAIADISVTTVDEPVSNQLFIQTFNEPVFTLEDESTAAGVLELDRARFVTCGEIPSPPEVTVRTALAEGFIACEPTPGEIVVRYHLDTLEQALLEVHFETFWDTDGLVLEDIRVPEGVEFEIEGIGTVEDPSAFTITPEEPAVSLPTNDAPVLEFVFVPDVEDLSGLESNLGTLLPGAGGFELQGYSFDEVGTDSSQTEEFSCVTGDQEFWVVW